MNTQQSFAEELNARIAKYDLLCHPFYKSWSMGALTREQISEYACDYYHHVAEFPNHLQSFIDRLPAGELRNLVTENKEDELGAQARDKRTHAEVWMDFATGMGAAADDVQKHQPIEEIRALIEQFQDVSKHGTTAEALAAFYAYESQVPRVATEKERGLKQHYGADDRTSYYFAIHKDFDVLHSQSWLAQLWQEVEGNTERAERALESAETAARVLWRALDGIEARRLASACH